MAAPLTVLNKHLLCIATQWRWRTVLGARVAEAVVGTMMIEMKFLPAKEWVIWLEWGDVHIHKSTKEKK